MNKRNLCVILNYNDYDNTIKYLNMVKRFVSYDYIVVVDNCSTDDSYERLKAVSTDKVSVVKTASNGGYASGNNFGIKYGIEHYGIVDYITISNHDIEITDDGILKLLETLNANSNLSQVSGVICDKDYRVRTDFAWKQRRYSDLLQESLPMYNRISIATSSHDRRYKRELIENCKIMGVDVIPGCFFIFRHDAFEEIGYFSTDTFLYIEEDFIAYKMKQRNMKAAIATDVRIAHYGGTSTKKNIRNYWVKEAIVLKSKQKYLEVCLRCNRAQYVLFNACSYIGIVERIVFKFFRDLLNKA